MKILHTSDLHLSEDKPQTLDALKEVLKIGKKKKVDAVTIAGDIFDTEEDAEALRPELREIFSGNSFKIYAIPGNHDRSVYTEERYFGEDLKVATEEPFQVFREKDTAIVAVPFRDEFSSELYSNLLAAGREASARVLLLHCTLDIGFSPKDFGEEEVVRYCPVSRSTLSALGFDFVLAGHFHTGWLQEELNGGQFVYPGSPTSHTWKEVGRRNVAIVDTIRGKVAPATLNSFYLNRLLKWVRPGEERKVLGEVEDWVREKSRDNCELGVTVDGFIEANEREFLGSLKDAARPAKVDCRCKNVEEVLKHPLYRRFVKKLKRKEDVKDKESVETRAIDAMSRLLAERRPAR